MANAALVVEASMRGQEGEDEECRGGEGGYDLSSVQEELELWWWWRWEGEESNPEESCSWEKIIIQQVTIE